MPVTVRPQLPGDAAAVRDVLTAAFADDGWMTGALVYCEALWAHDCVGLRTGS